MTTPSSTSPPTVGLIPAAGLGRRLGPLPGSKEMFPLGWDAGRGRDPRPKVVSHYLLEKMVRAGVEVAYVVIRDGKWDIPAYWGDGHRLGLHLAYLMMRLPHGTPFSLDQAYPFVKDHRVLMGFPDILLAPDDVFIRLLQKQTETGADLVLGLFRAQRPEKADMVAFDDENRPSRIVIKPPETTLTYTWLCAVWTPSFTHLLHEMVAEAIEDPSGQWTTGGNEMYVGHVVQRAIDEGMEVEAVWFDEGSYTDIGTPEALAEISDHHVDQFHDGAQTAPRPSGGADSSVSSFD